MQQNNIKFLLAFLGFGVIFSSIIIMLIQDKQELVEKNNLLAAENQNLSIKNQYLKKDPIITSDEQSYLKWNNLNKVATKFVKDSNGNFKKPWALYLVKEAKTFNIDPHITYELLKLETGGTFNPKIVGPDTIYGHAYGMAQFMKNTAPWIAEMAGVPYSKKMLFNPFYSIHLSFVYLDFLYQQYGSWDKALTAYNRGMGGLEIFIEKNGHARSNYSSVILTKANAHPKLTIVE